MRTSLLFLVLASVTAWVLTGCQPAATTGDSPNNDSDNAGGTQDDVSGDGSAGTGDTTGGSPDATGDATDAGDTTSDGGSPTVATIEMLSGGRFEPRDVTVAPGSTVRWVNSHTLRHTATSDTGVFSSDGDFPSGLNAGQTWEWTVPNAQEVGSVLYYHCRFHASPGDGIAIGSGMVGSLTIGDAS